MKGGVASIKVVKKDGLNIHLQIESWIRDWTTNRDKEKKVIWYCYAQDKITELDKQILNSKEKTTPAENKSDKKVFIVSAVFVLSLVILGAYIGSKEKLNDFSFVKIENRFGIKEINNLININDDFKTSCEKLRMLSPNTYTITPGESYYWCSINDGNINLISYDNKTVDGFVTTFNYKGFQNLSIEEVKKLFRKKGYEEFSKESAEWVSFNKTESLVLKIDDFQQITYLSLDKYIQNKNKVSKNLTKVRDYVHSINKAITQECKVIKIFPYFLAAGKHVKEDIPAEIKRFKKRYPEIEFKLLPHIGECKGIENLILDNI